MAKLDFSWEFRYTNKWRSLIKLNGSVGLVGLRQLWYIFYHKQKCTKNLCYKQWTDKKYLTLSSQGSSSFRDFWQSLFLITKEMLQMLVISRSNRWSHQTYNYKIILSQMIDHIGSHSKFIWDKVLCIYAGRISPYSELKSLWHFFEYILQKVNVNQTKTLSMKRKLTLIMIRSSANSTSLAPNTDIVKKLMVLHNHVYYYTGERNTIRLPSDAKT